LCEKETFNLDISTKHKLKGTTYHGYDEVVTMAGGSGYFMNGF